MSTEFDHLLNVDPVAEAEKVTGESILGSEMTQTISRLFAQAKERQVRDEFLIRNDTYKGMSIDAVQEVLDDAGFVFVVTEAEADHYRRGEVLVAVAHSDMAMGVYYRGETWILRDGGLLNLLDKIQA